MPDGISHPLGYAPPTREPDVRLMARAAAMREAAAEIAMDLGFTPAWQRDRIASLLAEHEALSLRAQAAEHMARGEPSLAKHYVRSAIRVEREDMARRKA